MQRPREAFVRLENSPRKLPALSRNGRAGSFFAVLMSESWRDDYISEAAGIQTGFIKGWGIALGGLISFLQVVNKSTYVKYPVSMP